MKALTLYEPCATAIAIGLKTVETRGHLIPGAKAQVGQRVAIHAGKMQDLNMALPRGCVPHPGCVVATATLQWIAKVERIQFFEHSPPSAIARLVAGGSGLREGPLIYVNVDEWGNFDHGRWLYKFSEVARFLFPVPARGYQGLWAWDEGAL